MENQAKRATQAIKTEEPGRRVILRRWLTPQERAERAESRPLRSCFDCVFCVSNVLLWARTLLSGFPVPAQCANHPDTPGQVRPIPHAPCRNFRAGPFRLDPPEPPNDKIRYIPLTRGLFTTIIDAEDYEWLSKYKWQTHRTPCGGVYAVHATSKGQLFMHRMIMNPPKGKVVGCRSRVSFSVATRERLVVGNGR
ncbi:MAG: hypothetical protein JW955_22470 [Sedimentisphaerales bacterium]|nr:hypothetical protein [Sedimentisphaerales bacterium]